MADIQSRRRLAEVTRHSVAGVITCDEWEERSLAIHDEMQIQDQGWWRVWRNIWALYDDFRTDSLRGEWALSKEVKADVARCLLFLYSCEEYEWFDATPNFRLFDVLTLGWWRRKVERECRGDRNYYPFFEKAQFDEARRNPALLMGRA